MGKIRQTLERLDLLDATLILFTSDHGPSSLGGGIKDRNYGSASPYRGHKYGLWNGSLQVPGIAHWPAQIQANTLIDIPAGSIDWLPTICEATQTPLPKNLELDGLSHLPLLLGKSDKAFTRKKPLQWHHYNTNFINTPNPNAVIRSGDYLICGFYDPKTQLKRSSWQEAHLSKVQSGKLIRFQLFNLKNDPAQKHDLSQRQPALFKKLKSQLIAAHLETQSQARGWQGTKSVNKLPGE